MCIRDSNRLTDSRRHQKVLGQIKIPTGKKNGSVFRAVFFGHFLRDAYYANILAGVSPRFFLREFFWKKSLRLRKMVEAARAENSANTVLRVYENQLPALGVGTRGADFPDSENAFAETLQPRALESHAVAAESEKQLVVLAAAQRLFERGDSPAELSARDGLGGDFGAGVFGDYVLSLIHI